MDSAQDLTSAKLDTQEEVTSLLRERILQALGALGARVRPWLQSLGDQLTHLLKDWLCALQDLFHRLWMRLQGWHGEDEPVQRKRHRRRTRFHFGSSTAMQPLAILCRVVLAGVFLFSLANLVSYGLDYMKAKQNSAALRELYYQDAGQESEAPETATPEPTAAPTAAQTTPQPISEPAVTAVPPALPTQPTTLAAVRYPGNPYGITSSKFHQLRQQNADIVGWLKIDGLIDEVVVQRDNTYYLDRDYRGYHNVNGAIFLDEHCNLRTRPYTYILYGHNMKSGLMFGSLRNYENLSFYKKNPFVTFDTAYEDGRYVIFAAAQISTDPTDWRFLNLNWLLSSSISYRSQAIKELKRFSVFTNGIEVLPEDQILLLITCVDDEKDRRLLAARRIRDNESEDALMRIVRTTR